MEIKTHPHKRCHLMHGNEIRTSIPIFRGILNSNISLTFSDTDSKTNILLQMTKATRTSHY